MSGQTRNCNADAACLSAEKVLDLLQKGLALAPEQSVLVAFTFPLDRGTIQACLDHPSIAGVILTDEDNARQFDDTSRVGFRFGFNGSCWRFPRAASRRVIVLGERDSVGLGIWRAALRHGVTTIVFVAPETSAVWRCAMAEFCRANLLS